MKTSSSHFHSRLIRTPRRPPVAQGLCREPRVHRAGTAAREPCTFIARSVARAPNINTGIEQRQCQQGQQRAAALHAEGQRRADRPRSTQRHTADRKPRRRCRPTRPAGTPSPTRRQRRHHGERQSRQQPCATVWQTAATSTTGLIVRALERPILRRHRRNRNSSASREG